MSFDNLKNKWTAREMQLLLYHASYKEITTELVDELVKLLPDRPRSGIRQKLRRMSKELNTPAKVEEVYIPPPKEAPKQEEPKEEDIRIKLARAVRAGETTFEEIALKHDRDLDHVETELTPFFKDVIQFLLVDNYNYYKLTLPPLPDRITSNMLKAFNDRDNLYKPEKIHMVALNG